MSVYRTIGPLVLKNDPNASQESKLSASWSPSCKGNTFSVYSLYIETVNFVCIFIDGCTEFFIQVLNRKLNSVFAFAKKHMDNYDAYCAPTYVLDTIKKLCSLI